MKKISNKVFAYCAAVLAVASVSTPSFASGASTIIDTAKDELVGSADGFVNLMLVIFGIVGIVFVVINAIKYFKQDHDSENNMFKVGIGIILGVIVIYVIKEALIR